MEQPGMVQGNKLVQDSKLVLGNMVLLPVQDSKLLLDSKFVQDNMELIAMSLDIDMGKLPS